MDVCTGNGNVGAEGVRRCSPLGSEASTAAAEGQDYGEKKERPVLQSKTDRVQGSRELCSGQEGGGEALPRGLPAGREDTPSESSREREHSIVPQRPGPGANWTQGSPSSPVSDPGK